MFRWSVGVLWWLVAVLSPVVLLTLAALILRLRGHPRLELQGDSLRRHYADVNESGHLVT